MPRRITIRTKLTFGALAPLFIAILICSMTGLTIINTRIARQAQEKVRTDLNSAREVYQNELAHISELVEFTASTSFTANALAAADRATLAALLAPLRKKKRLDILTAVDSSGQVIYRAHNPRAFGDNRGEARFVASALGGKPATGTEVLTFEELAAEREELGRQATIGILPTPHARPGAKDIERSGMVLVSAAPVRDRNGNIVGALYGGVLLNNDNTVVDKIKEIVYEGVKFDGKEVGTATIFLGDLRIATNVRASDGSRAIGTRLSEEVYNRVIKEKKKWISRAFVVNDWYLSAYEPILDLKGEAIGSLYVGMLEEPYSALKRNINLIFGAVLVVTTLIGLALSGVIGAHLARPIKELETLARRVAVGERDLQIEVRTGDELEDLASEFNEMTRALAQREAEISSLNRGLEQKVMERTAELEEKSTLLLKTQADLARAEKLADLGILSAGVAHEINNPLAIIRGNTEVLEMSIPPEHPSREEIDIISQQTERMAKIVANLLAFARQKPMQREEVDIHRLLDEILAQIGHQIPLDNIRVNKDYAPDLRRISGDAGQLRQVFTNLVLNAVQAMPEGGSLRIGATNVQGSKFKVQGADKKNVEHGTLNIEPDADFIEISVRDTGKGIPPEHLKKIFTPFFTTKENGTGLGLSLSYGIVKDHGGTIKVETEEGKGTTFRVTLPG
ncbi:MAG: cache domain-containing protein [Geobacter sp.]|nr:cache domain-containing protein [Geobacter sp.]